MPHPDDLATLERLSTDGYFVRTGLAARIAAGAVTITLGERNWPDGWYKDPYRKSIQFALELADAVPAITSLHLSYDRDTDFHHIQFTLDGVTYTVRWYRVWAVGRSTDKKSMLFNANEGRVVEFFRRGDHLGNHWF